MIPESEIQIDFARSGGPGGQNVNKVSSKAIVRWHVGNSHTFNNEQKAKIRIAAGKRLNKNDEIIIDSDNSRSQVNNKEKALAKLNILVSNSLVIKKPRKATKISRSKKQKRLNEKKQHSQKKALRKTPSNF